MIMSSRHPRPPKVAPNWRLDASQPPPANRSGAVLIAVMVVLLVVGLLMRQTTQTLLLIRRADDQRQALRQARELVNLGQAVWVHRGDDLPETDIVVRAAGAAPLGILRFQTLEASDTADKRVRLTVVYLPGTTSELTLTHLLPRLGGES